MAGEPIRLVLIDGSGSMIAEFNRAELMVAPALQTEGKHLQRDQGVGMAAANGKAAVALVNE